MLSPRDHERETLGIEARQRFKVSAKLIIHLIFFHRLHVLAIQAN